MIKQYIIPLFIVIAIIQLIVPAKMMYDQEKVLKTGNSYKFKTEPIDPNDPFRGKYITLRYQINNAFSSDTTWQRKEDVYVYLKEDNNDFASVDTVSKEQLHKSNDYILAKANYYNKNNKKLHFRLLLDRFYMNENKAYDAEIVYREAQRDSIPNNTYAIIMIKGDKAVLKDVMINNISISKYVE